MSGQSASTKAEDSGDWHGAFDDVAHDVDLLENAVEELGAVSRADKELLGPGSKEAALDLERGAALVSLGVDDVDAGRRDGDVVDVWLRAGDATVVEHSHRFCGEVVEVVAEALLADGAGVPCGCRLGVVTHRHDEAAEHRMPAVDPSLSLRLAAFELASGRGARPSDIDRFRADNVVVPIGLISVATR